MDSVAPIILKQRHIPAPGLQLSTYVRLLAVEVKAAILNESQ